MSKLPQLFGSALSTHDRKTPNQESFEPVDAVRAPLNSAGCATSNGTKREPPPGCGGFSRGKNRFMAALLGKIVKSKAANPGSAKTVGDPQAIGSGADQDSLDDESLDHQLRETQLCENMPSSVNPINANHESVRSMAFTYAPGSKPLSQYTIRCGVGMGGFGEVYFALSEAGKEVALKRIQRNLEVELRGASHCLNLKHPNLVALFDICRDPADQAWVVMEYINGPNLRHVLDLAPNGLAEQDVRRWFRGIALGVNHLHSAGLVHRDLKPGNVFDDMGVIKVGDYGLSKFISASHRGGHTESVGTFHYMAPEIGRGQYGREIDIYALGILLFEMLTGEVPFDGESCHEIIVKHLTAMPDLTKVAQPYRQVIDTALHKDPSQRYATVVQMLADLGMADDDANVTTPTLTSPTLATPTLATPVIATATETEPPIVAQLVSEPVARFNNDADVNVATATFAATSPTVAPAASQDEPLARAVRESVSELKRFWGSLDRSPGAKKVLLGLAGFALFLNTHWLFPVLSLIGIFYVPYYIVRQMVLQVRQQPTYAEAQRIATAAGAPVRPATKDQWRNYMRTDLRAKRSIHRIAELSTSWVAATLTVIAMAIIAGVFGLRSGEVNAFSLAPFGWMAIVVLLGSLSILGMGKLWERDDGEALPRRLVLAGVGAGVGVAAFIANEFLLLPIDDWMSRNINATTLPQALYLADGTPRASAMMAHFALLFAAVRWWKPVDPLRRTRLSLWSVAVTVVAAWAVHQILPIPQPYGMMMAGGIAIAVQMSAPWMDPRARSTRPTQPESQPEYPRNPEATPSAEFQNGGQII